MGQKNGKEAIGPSVGQANGSSSSQSQGPSPSISVSAAEPVPPASASSSSNTPPVDSLGLPADDMIYSVEPRVRVARDDFELLKVVGKGNFGKVMQVKHKGTGKIYAMKVLKKELILRKDQLEHTMTERRVLQHVQNPFLVRLNYAFQTVDSLYMILDFIPGGELFFHLKREKRFTEDRAKFYAAEIAIALSTLHRHGVIYRDLKPENVLLDSEGHVCLTDFGLSKEVAPQDGRTHTFCGTPEYLAPEILLFVGQDFAVDWWSLGTIMFEFICGLPPFYSESIDEMYQMILYSELYIPDFVSDEAADLLKRLLEKDPKRRLGSGPNGFDNFKSHPFFRDLNWQDVYDRKLTPPFCPVVKGDRDTSNFDPEFTSELPKESLPNSGGALGKSYGGAFEGFTYTAPNAFAQGE